MKRAGNDPRRRVASADYLNAEDRQVIAERAKYVGSGHHKRSPADYGFDRISPRPTKSLCDGLRPIKLDEARDMLKNAICSGMVSKPFAGKYPKFVWYVDAEGEVYEANTDENVPGVYHGYRLEEDDNVRDYILHVWKDRCHKIGQ
jgi:hypothetical protein